MKSFFGAQEFVEHTDHRRIDPYAFGLSPLQQRGLYLSANVEKLGSGQFQTSFTGFHSVYRFASTFRRAKRTVVARSPLTRASSGTASRRSSNSHRANLLRDE